MLKPEFEALMVKRGCRFDVTAMDAAYIGYLAGEQGNVGANYGAGKALGAQQAVGRYPTPPHPPTGPLAARLGAAVRGGRVRRYHTLPIVGENTVAEHSFMVAWLCYILCNGKPSTELLVGALAHDLAESVTGDLPAPMKRQCGEAVLKFEVEFNDGLQLPPLLPFEEVVLKLADYLDGWLFTLGQLQRGNQLLTACHARYEEYIDKILAQAPDYRVIVGAIKGAANV